MTTNIKKAVICVSEAKNSLYPLEVQGVKELFPLGNIPVIQHIVDELLECDVEKIIFLLPSEKKAVAEHFSGLKKGEAYDAVQFSCLTYKKGTGTGTLLSKAKNEIDEDDFFLVFSDALFSGKKGSAAQLLNPYRTSKKMVLGLAEVEEEMVSRSYIVETEKIANRFYKIKKIMKKPDPGDTESRLAIVPRYVFSPLLFSYLRNGGKDAFLDAINSMIAAGKTIYGYACDGEWYSMKDKEGFLKTQKHFIRKLEGE